MHIRARGLQETNAKNFVFVSLFPEKVTFSGEKVVFRNERVTFSALKVILSCIDIRIIMHFCYTGHEAFLFGGLNQKK